MPENRKERKNCHGCGLEALEECETENKHLPFDESLEPCRFCRRNHERQGPMVGDFYHTNWTWIWTLNGDKTPMIEDPDPHAIRLLKTLSLKMQGGERIVRA